ncbi:MAG: acetyltransferase [Mycobacterium sp.]|nr:MAG: acetyltransferase [Mycobacterium sp.]
MSFRIRPLRLESFEQLPKHARRCVFWEVDPETVNTEYLPDPEFEKEAWLSMVMLEWGSCGQLATATRPALEDGDAGDAETCLGYVLYAPPRLVPRAQRMPTSPVSADAVLLTSMGVEPGQPEGMPTMLIGQVVAELVRRGVRALEAFGRTAEAAEVGAVDGTAGDVDPQIAAAVAALGDCAFDRCMIDADFLLDAGFTVVAPHRYFPRLRLELDKGLGWKAEVEAALERLLEGARLEHVV